jgi:hypothetical protein
MCRAPLDRIGVADMPGWKRDTDLDGLIDLYFEFAPDPDRAETELKTWLTSEIQNGRQARSRSSRHAAPRPTASSTAVRLKRGPTREAGKKSQPSVPAQQSSATEWMDSSEVAAYLRLSVKTVRNWRSIEEGPQFAKRGGVILYRKADVDVWLEGGLR